MPSISMFYGIIIYMFFKDNQKHSLPHIHAEYSGERAVLDISTGNILEGKLPPKQVQLISAWIILRQEELFANWKLAVEGEPIYKIEPLR